MARETPNIFAMSLAVMPLSRSVRALAAAASSTLRGRPPLRPLAAAAASPARLRSIMVPHLVLVAGERLATGLAGVGVPQTHGGVVTAGGDAVPVGTERHTAHLDRVAGMDGGVAEDTDAVDQAVAPLIAEGLSVLSG